MRTESTFVNLHDKKPATTSAMQFKTKLDISASLLGFQYAGKRFSGLQAPFVVRRVKLAWKSAVLLIWRPDQPE